jgi:hypothetical protein
MDLSLELDIYEPNIDDNGNYLSRSNNLSVFLEEFLKSKFTCL